MTGIEEIINRIQERITLTHSSTMTQYDCPICQDTGWVSRIRDDGYTESAVCECVKAKKAAQMIRDSGLGDLLDSQTFDTFSTETDVQRKMLDTAKRYTTEIISGESAKRPWLYIGGNPGCGKTHICTAVCGELLKANIPVRYMQWNEQSRRLKAYVNEPDFEAIVDPYVDAPVLYVDDLFKQQYKLGGPYLTDADIRLAFTVLDGRYTRNKPTIISSEWFLIDDLMAKDEGTFSRVYERAKSFTLNVPRDAANNYRLRRVQRADNVAG